MTATAGMMLLNQIVPMIAAAIGRGAVRPVGVEDHEELRAEACALAAALLDSAESRGKPVTPGNIAHFALQGLRSGRRSGYTGRADALCPAAALDGNVTLQSLDEPVGYDSDGDDEISLHDLMASGGEDVDVAAARHLDWDAVVDTLNDRQRYTLTATAQGSGVNEMAAELAVSPPRVVQLKREVGRRIVNVWGNNGLGDVVREPGWRQGLRAWAERRAARYERAHA